MIDMLDEIEYIQNQIRMLNINRENILSKLNIDNTRRQINTINEYVSNFDVKIKILTNILNKIKN